MGQKGTPKSGCRRKPLDRVTGPVGVWLREMGHPEGLGIIDNCVNYETFFDKMEEIGSDREVELSSFGVVTPVSHDYSHTSGINKRSLRVISDNASRATQDAD